MKYKKYILFCSNTFYPAGGLADIVGSYDTLEEAKANFCCDGGEIVDRDTWEIVSERSTGGTRGDTRWIDLKN
jgi:hypothetical protein